ncbi:MAG: DUF3592 domain-containing protein [Pseudomonadota bacterium]
MNPTNTIRGSKAGVIFGGIFFFAGLMAAYFTFGHMTLKYFASADWYPVHAQLSELELQRNYGESTTYSVNATYHYSVNGRDYTGYTVGLSSGSDNIGDYWQELHNKLQQQRSQDQVFALVNPDDPAQAMLDRTYRWEQLAFGMLFVLTFCVVGGVIAWFSMRKQKTTNEQRLSMQQSGIASNEKHGHWFLLWFGLVFFAVGTLPAFWVLPEAIRDGEYGAFALLLFSFVGLGIMIWGARQRKNYKTIGPTPLYLDPMPGAIGGQVGGYFDVGALVWEHPLQVSLNCVRRTKSGDKTSSRIIWQTSDRAYSQQTANGMRVKFLFDCPADKPATKPWQNRSSIHWEVAAEGDLNIRGQEQAFSRSWEVPVESGASIASSSVQIPQHFLDETEAANLQQARESAAEQIPISRDGANLNIVSEAGRGLMGCLMGVLFGAIFGGVGVFTIGEGWWPGYIFALIGVITIASCLFVLGRRIEVNIDTQMRMLSMRRSLFGIPLYSREVALFNPDQFSIKLSSSSTSGRKRTEYYSVLIDNSGKKVKIAEGVTGRDTAEVLVEKIVEEAFPNRDR